MSDSTCLAIMMSASPSCSGGCQPNYVEQMVDGSPEYGPDGTCVTPGTATVDAACVYTAPVEGEEMMNALYANTLGNAFFSCQTPPTPCPRDASRADSSAVVMACAVDAACAAKEQLIFALIDASFDGSPVQAQADLDASTW